MLPARNMEVKLIFCSFLCLFSCLPPLLINTMACSEVVCHSRVTAHVEPCEPLDRSPCLSPPFTLHTPAQVFQRHSSLGRTMLPSSATPTTRASIATIPDELLARIFVKLQQSYTQCPSRKWLSVLLVCRRWYNIAVSFPILWAMFEQAHVDNEEVLSTALARAGACPLSICVADVNYDNFARVVRLLGETYHTQSIELHIPQSLLARLQWCLYNLNIPAETKLSRLLEALLIYVDEDDEGNEAPLNLEDLLHGESLRLTSMKLCGVPSLSGMTRAPNLTSLHIGTVLTPHHTAKMCMDTVAILLRSLREMHAVRHLSVVCIAHRRLRFPSSDCSYSGNAVLLPASLRRFGVQGGTTCAALHSIIGHIVLPPTCHKITLEFASDSRDGADIPPLTSALYTLLKEVSPHPSARIRDDRPLTLTVLGTDADEHFGLEICTHSPAASCHSGSICDTRDYGCAEKFFSLHITDKFRCQPALLGLFKVVPFSLNIRKIKLNGTPVSCPNDPIVPEEHQDQLMGALTRFRAATYVDIVEGSLAKPVTKEQMREFMPQLELLTFEIIPPGIDFSEDDSP